MARGKAALLYCRTSFNQNGKPIEYTKAINRGDRYQFTYEIDC
ncbi:MAG TPA: UTRA domain-containing protein [Clostridia bacterium]|nr:UTRA domain-containing protein [Clostridia bacterium]